MCNTSPVYTAHAITQSVFFTRDPLSIKFSAINGKILLIVSCRPGPSESRNKFVGTSILPLNVYKSVCGNSHSIIPSV